MLIDDLTSLRDRLQSYEHTGLSITPAALRGICAIVDTAIKDAQAMQAHAINQPCIKVLPIKKTDNGVVDFSDEKARRDIETWITGQGVCVITADPDGGDAA